MANETRATTGRDGWVNIGPGEQALTLIAGGALVGAGLARCSLRGLLSAAIGGGLLFRGLSGHCYTYELLGINRACRAGRRRNVDPLYPPEVESPDPAVAANEVDEASWESFPASDPPGWISKEPA